MMLPDHPTVHHGKIGVLLVNLGTPDAPDPGSVRRYLAEFLSDRRVVELPRILWQPLLHGVILTTRPKKSAEAYAQVWGEDGSPLAAITAAQARALQERLGDGVRVAHAMRYGRPALGVELARLKDLGCDRILIAPLYPQYCAATTATAIDAMGAALAKMRWQPAIRTLPPYYDDPAHIPALAGDLARQLAALSFVPEALLLSFHGMPQRTLELGDPYHCHCRKTARLLGEALGRDVIVTFQSRFGRAKWLEPATEPTLIELAKAGVRRVDVICPGFASDCLETLEEISIEGRKAFIDAGGKQFHYIPCLNDDGDWIGALGFLAERHLAGWPTREMVDPAALAQSRERALAAGAQN